MKFSFLIPFQTTLLSLFLIRTISIVDILSYANFSGASLSNFSTSILANNGQTSYISLKSGSQYIIKKYNINVTTGALTYVNMFVDPYNQIFSDRLMFYNAYLIAVSTNSLFFNAFGLADYVFYGNYTIN